MEQGVDQGIDQEPESLLINEAQFLLADKRTQLATVRTGLALLAVPMSIMSVLVVTSRFYHFWGNFWYLLPLLSLCVCLLTLGIHLVLRGTLRLHRIENTLRRIIARSPHLNHLG
ncbi:MAG: hypothetical protein KKC30_04905 [Proteobacteria bacterium]|nr:hypothetical protein [Pseudomonadota bacterium]MBU4276063.1 hypothetical protein [Pseudomonadota bacterium]MBU4384098.1 hypothetical protein [Pseudomonadota bacterium]MBU4604522.1 hypothetical protein [Pseudomonadota bacterium]MCG2763737.1 hypothetical protein [Desulfarculaceae bacterium]